jgi:hypothetical protein
MGPKLSVSVRVWVMGAFVMLNLFQHPFRFSARLQTGAGREMDPETRPGDALRHFFRLKSTERRSTRLRPARRRPVVLGLFVRLNSMSSACAWNWSAKVDRGIDEAGDRGERDDSLAAPG